MGIINNIGYNGGSPRNRNEYKPTKSPKIYDLTDAEKLINVIEQQFLKNTISIQELKFIINRCKTLETGTNMMGAQVLTPGIITNKFISAIENLYSDDKINNLYLKCVIKGLEQINIYPIKEDNNTLPVENETISSLPTPQSNNVRTPKVKKVINNLVKAKELKSIINKIKDYYLDRKFSKDELDNFKMYLLKLKQNSNSVNPPMSFFLNKTYEFIKTLYSDEKLSHTQLNFIIQEVSILYLTQLPELPKVKEQKPKDKINTLAVGYKK